MNWQILGQLKETVAEKRREEILRILLKNRGLTSSKEKEDFLEVKEIEAITAKKVGIPEKNLKTAIERIKRAIDNQEKIVIYGDYDADGICGTAILWEIIFELGGKVMPFIPGRETEGYGLKPEGVEKIKATLLITVDNGIVAFEGVDYAKKKGMEVIVTDHHLPKLKVKPCLPAGRSEKLKVKAELPDAYAVIHTTLLSGSGVAWLLGREIVKNLGTKKLLEEFNRRFTELATMGTIADLSELTGANRIMVKEGLKQLNQTARLGLKAILQAAGLTVGQIEPWHVSFILAPRFNATGRLEDAMDALRLICTQKPEQAIFLAQKLDRLNAVRQRLTEETLKHARNLFLKRNDATRPLPLIFLSHRSYHQGVVGLVAGKLAEEFFRPAIVVALTEDFGKASARSIPGLNIIEIIRETSGLLIDCGGHPMAAGFTVEKKNLEELEKKLLLAVSKKLNKELLERQLLIDCEIKLSDVTWELYQKLEKMEPFGMGNPRPTFGSHNLRICQQRCVGGGNKHLQLRFDDPQTIKLEKTRAEMISFDWSIKGIAFNCGHLSQKFGVDDRVDVVYTIEPNFWNGQKNLELKIKDIKLSDEIRATEK